MTTASKTPTKRTIVLAALIDVIAVIFFTAIGRSSHAEALDLAGFSVTLWPFLAGTIIGWTLSRSWRAPVRIWPNGLLIWANTVVFGMFFRALSGQGVQLSFVIVASIATGILLIGWRLVALIVGRVLAKRRG